MAPLGPPITGLLQNLSRGRIVALVCRMTTNLRRRHRPAPRHINLDSRYQFVKLRTSSTNLPNERIRYLLTARTHRCEPARITILKPSLLQCVQVVSDPAHKLQTLCLRRRKLDLLNVTIGEYICDVLTQALY